MRKKRTRNIISLNIFQEINKEEERGLGHCSVFMDGTYRDETSLRFLHPISNRDKNVRKHAFDATTRTIETWLTGYATPFNSLESIASVNGVGNNIAIAKLQERIPDLLRLVCGCPFKDIRDKSKCLLDDLKV